MTLENTADSTPDMEIVDGVEMEVAKPSFELGEALKTVCAGIKAMIVSPVGDRPTGSFAHCMVDTAIACGMFGLHAEIKWMFGHSDLAYARNALIAQFLQTDCTELLFIDDDMCWDAKDAVKLLISDKEVVGGSYARKLNLGDENPLQHAAFLLPGEPNRDQNDLIEVRGIGLGFFKISRSAIEKIIRERPEVKRPADHPVNDDGIKDFYRMFHFDGFGCSEDYYFCDLWRSVGGQVWVDPTVKLGHVGDFEYRASLEALLPKKGDG